MKYILYTYSGLADLRKIEESLEVVPFVFQETFEMLQNDPHICIEITALVHYLLSSPRDRYSAYINLRAMTEETIVIVDESAADNAIALFPLLFSETSRYNEPMVFPEDCSKEKDFSLVRKPIYTYKSNEEFDNIIEYTKEKFIPIATFSQASGTAKTEFEQFNRSAKLALLDLTSVSFAIESNKNLIYLVESILNIYPNINVIVKTAQIDNLLDYFPLYFEEQKSVYELLPDLKNEEEGVQVSDSIVHITDFSKERFESFFSWFNRNLVGHRHFKEKLKHALKNFVALCKAKEQKVFSIFLFGVSGIGKTEVARLIANGLCKGCYLAKINFQNYSSQDALNSLIGSPAGYIGCDHGELSDKIGKTKVGVLLCDEFEKTTRPVFLFFLELLEEGHFTDSMAREYDLEGFIIVFTSNIRTQKEYEEKIPSELQTRFDLVCEFEKPTMNDKRDFLGLLLEKAKQKYEDLFSKFTMTEEDEKYLLGFDYSNIDALRDIKRLFNNRLMDLFETKGL